MDSIRRDRVTESQLILTVNDRAENIDNSTQVDASRQADAILLDFAKAFDKVPNSHLLLKLNHYGIRNCTINWFTDFLTNHTRRIT